MTVNNVTTTNPVATTTAANPVVKKVQTPAEQRKAEIKAAVKAALSNAGKKLVKAAPFIAGAVLPPAIVGTVYMVLNKKPDDKGTGTGTAGQQTGTPDGTATGTTTGTGGTDAGTTTPAAERLSTGQKIGLGVGLVALTILSIYCRPSARKARELNSLIAKRRAEGEIREGDIRALKKMPHKDAIDVLSAPANDDEVARRVRTMPYTIKGNTQTHLTESILNGTVTHRTAIITLKLMEPAEAAAAAKAEAYERTATDLSHTPRTAVPSKTKVAALTASLGGRAPGRTLASFRTAPSISFAGLDADKAFAEAAAAEERAAAPTFRTTIQTEAVFTDVNTRPTSLATGAGAAVTRGSSSRVRLHTNKPRRKARPPTRPPTVVAATAAT